MDRLESLITLPPRPADGHKGTFGTALIVGGCAGRTRMIGAPALAARAAARAGAGLTRVLAPEPIVDHVLALAPHATAVAIETHDDGTLIGQSAIAALDEQLQHAQSVVIGPGLGAGETSKTLVLRAVGQEDVAAVVDADAINALVKVAEFWREIRGQIIFTPHPGEFRRLAQALGLSFELRDADSRIDAAGEMARRLGAIVVLKGAHTVVSDGQRYWVCGSACACLATGGTGDVLAGLLAGLIAQYPASASDILMAKTGRPQKPTLFELACVAVEAHARAGERWAELHGADAGLLPMELADLLPGVLQELRLSKK
ncbi:MAG: NAD(P)H-hydrate dehydratase [Planctomycetota bacterium]|nr:MAG: NAD(P)H-hydrate dehydratase [Planctomycetota bacterium]